MYSVTASIKIHDTPNNGYAKDHKGIDEIVLFKGIIAMEAAKEGKFQSNTEKAVKFFLILQQNSPYQFAN